MKACKSYKKNLSAGDLQYVDCSVIHGAPSAFHFF